MVDESVCQNNIPTLTPGAGLATNCTVEILTSGECSGGVQWCSVQLLAVLAAQSITMTSSLHNTEKVSAW